MLITLQGVISLISLLVLMITLLRSSLFALLYTIHVMVVSSLDDLATFVQYFMIQVWDYQTKSCVQTLEGHTHNVSAVCFHPELPIIITGSEDGTVRIWHATTYR